MSTIEERLSRVESGLARLETKVEDLEVTDKWIDCITGSFKDDPEFDKILRLGREIRQADRPEDE